MIIININIIRIINVIINCCKDRIYMYVCGHVHINVSKHISMAVRFLFNNFIVMNNIYTIYIY